MNDQQLLSGPSPDDHARWEAETLRREMQELRTQALSAALQAHLGGADDRTIVRTAEAFHAFLTGEDRRSVQ